MSGPRVGHAWSVGAVAAVFLAAHLVQLAPSLGDIDSFNFALGLRDYDVAAHQPHPPGYPVFIALGRLSLAVVEGLGFGAGSPTAPEALALAFWGALGGALLAPFLFIAFDAVTGDRGVAFWTMVLTLACPLVWFTASRPLSDVIGLAAAAAAQALMLVAWRRQQSLATRIAAGSSREERASALVAAGRPLVLSAFIAGFAIGIRTQTAWLTLPLLIVVIAARAGRGASGALLGATMAFATGVLLWLVPLIVTTGLDQFLASLGGQAGDDLVGVDMLVTNPTLRHLAFALYETLVLAWERPVLAGVVLLLAAIGAARLAWRDARAFAVLAAMAAPYAAFHLLLQETLTTRYAVPIVPAVACLAALGLRTLAGRWLWAGALPVAAAALALGVPALRTYAAQASPVVRAMTDLERRGDVPAIGMHHSIARALRGEPIAKRALPSVARLELRPVLDRWRSGETGPVWFLASAERTDLRRIDPQAIRIRGSFELMEPAAVYLGGVRPGAVRLLEIAPPGWFAGEGWALTPEIAGVSRMTGTGPAIAPIQAWVRRRPGPAVLLVGGRNLGPAGSPDVDFELRVDGALVDSWRVAPEPGFFLRMITLDAGRLAGEGYAELTIGAAAAGGTDPARRAVSASIEQFDLQDPGTIVFGFDTGWHEQELDGRSGRSWRWASRSAALRIHAPAGEDVRVRIAGESPLRYFDRPSAITLRAGSSALQQLEPRADFLIEAVVSAAALEASRGVVTLEADQSFVPAERQGTADRRELALRVFDVQVVPVR